MAQMVAPVERLRASSNRAAPSYSSHEWKRMEPNNKTGSNKPHSFLKHAQQNLTVENELK